MAEASAAALYLAQHREAIENALTAALNACLETQPSSPNLFLASHFAAHAHADGLPPSVAHAAREAARSPSDSFAAPAPRHPSVDGLPDDHEQEWSASAWVSSLDVGSILADALLAPVRKEPGREIPSAAELTFVRRLGDVEAGGCAAIAGLLHRFDVVERLAEEMWAGVVALSRAKAATGRELHQKFLSADSSFELSYGSLQQFFSGLEALVGPPDPKLLKAMTAEHCRSADSQVAFTTTNYDVTTTSECEWHFVVDPVGGLAKLGRERYPDEARSIGGDHRRVARAPDDFAADVAAINARLAAAGTAALVIEEFYGARLYTGPMFVKLNATLRGISGTAPLARQAEQLCMGNRYTTTLHSISSAIVKMSKLQRAARVYRGVSGGVLPKEFWQADESSGVRGGVEFSFLSTTLDRDVALGYAAAATDSGRAGVVFEIQMGLVDRGADLSWLSQYPHEQEILFGPLTGLEAVATRVDGGVLVVSVRLSVNLGALTIEQVVSKRRKVVMDMAANMQAELVHEVQTKEWAPLRKLVGAAAERATRCLDDQLAQVTSHPPEYYNNDTKLGAAIRGAVESKGFVTRWPQLLLEGVPPMQRVRVGDARLLERCLVESDSIVRTCVEGEIPLVEMSFGLGPTLAQVALSSSLRELNLGGNKLTDAHLLSLCNAIALNSSLELMLLTLERNQITTVEPIVKLLPTRLASLRRLDVSMNKLKSAALRMLADALPAARQLRRIDVLRQATVTPEADAEYLIARAEESVAAEAAIVATLRDAMPAATSTAATPAVRGGREYSGDWHRDGGGGGVPTGAQLRCAQSAALLEALDATKKRLVPKGEWMDLVNYDGVPVHWDQLAVGGISLCGRLLNGPSVDEATIRLELRELKRPPLIDADAMLIAASIRLLGAARHVRAINLMGNSIADKGVVHLMRALSVPSPLLSLAGVAVATRLHTLRLANNRLGSCAMGAICEALPVIGAELVELALGYQPIGRASGRTAEQGDESMRNLAAALRHAPKLEILALQRCDMQPPGLAQLVTGLPSVPRLKKLMLDSNVLGNASLGALLRAGPALEVLSLQDAAITDPSQLLEALQEPAVAPKLAQLYLGANAPSVDPHVHAALRETAATRGLELLHLDVQVGMQNLDVLKKNPTTTDQQDRSELAAAATATRPLVSTRGRAAAGQMQQSESAA